MSLYAADELIINPEFQRYFRWEDYQKTRFIESILLGIPVPPIFVFQLESGAWELVDGLQRLSTIFEFAGILRHPDGTSYSPSILQGTRLLPSLSGKRWQPTSESDDNGLDLALQREIKRSRMRVEILKKDSDPKSKYELFQRLNTGGSILSEQELRSCIAIMIDRTFHAWILELKNNLGFQSCIELSETAAMSQKDIELVIRFIVYRNYEYESNLDVHEYLDKGVIELAGSANLDRDTETRYFVDTFQILGAALGKDSFKRYDGTKFSGQFSISAYEAIVIGLSKNIEDISALGEKESIEYVREKVRKMWNKDVFRQNSGAGVRGTSRLSKLLPWAINYFTSEED